jgi:hypothetical protein
MLIALVLLSFTFAFVLFLLWYAPWKLRVSSLETLDELLIPISIPALANLISEQNIEFLRNHLSTSDFRKAKRERNRVLCVYLRRIAHNARVLIAAAESRQRIEHLAAVDAARELLHAAMTTRTQALFALMTLYVSRVVPGLIADVPSAVRSYESTSASWDRFHAALSS